MADTHSHDAQLHRHEPTHVTQELRHGQQGEHMDTSHDTSTTTPPSAMPPGRAAPPGAAHRPVIGGCVADVPWHKLRHVGRSWALGRCVMG